MDNELTKINEEIEDETEEIEEIPERSGIGTGWAMLIGSGLTLAGIAIGKKAKKAWANRKTKKETPKADEPVAEAEAEIVEDQQPESEEETEK